MMEIDYPSDSQEPDDISFLREWLPKISAESRHLIFGEILGLLHAQENTDPPPNPNLEEESGSSDTL